jgi:AcrR family transcriptional regulator
MPLNRRTIEAKSEIRRHLSSIEKKHITPGRSSILEATFRLLASGGYASISMRNVAKSVDLKPSSIYSHFPNGRDEIIVEALRWNYHGWGTELLDNIDKSDNASEVWDRLVDVYVRRQLTIPYHDIWDMLWSMDQISEFLPAACRDELRSWLKMLHDLIGSIIIDMGFVHNEQSVHLVISILDSVTSWCGWSGKEEDLAYHVQTANTITRMILQRHDIFETRPRIVPDYADAMGPRSARERRPDHNSEELHRLIVSPKIGR